MSRYLPSRRCLWTGLALWAVAAILGWMAIGWPAAVSALASLLASAAVWLFLALRPPSGPERRQLPSTHYRLLRPEDEEEVERLYQRLRSVGRIDSRNSADET